jgi:hypothetical protein
MCIHVSIINKRREIINANSPGSELEQFICSFVKILVELSHKICLCSITPTMEDDGSPPQVLPVPAKGNGCRFNKAEVVVILLQYSQRNKQYAKLKSAILANEKEVNCPFSEGTIQ